MPRDVGSLLEEAFEATKLSILVFGPQVHTISTDERTRNLQNKRIEIRAKLEECGHHVRYAEDVVDPSVGGSSNNPFFQELVIMQDYDFIVTIVDSPGSIAEATVIAMKPRLAQKSSLFLDSNYVGGLVGAACHNAADLGAHFQTYNYPQDLIECNLLGYIMDRAEKIQKIKYLL